jgi:hypothetical protein
VRNATSRGASALRRTGSGERLGQGKQRNEALDRSLVALGGQGPRAFGIGERPPAPEHGAERVGVGVDDRVGLVSVPASHVELIVGDVDAEAVLAESQLEAGAESGRGPRVEPRAERQDHRVSRANRSVAAADMSLANVVRLNVYTTDVDEAIRHFPRLNEGFGDSRYATSILGVTHLPAQFLVMLEATAVD